MKCNTLKWFCFSLMVFLSCEEDKKLVEPTTSKPNKVVLISLNAPSEAIHFVKQDSIGKALQDSLGPTAHYPNNGFTYLDYLNNVQTWLPEPNAIDTLTIECYTDYLELSRKNFFTSLNETFLVKNGDTVLFRYEHNIPKAEVTNREVHDLELNYNSNRHRILFNNKYTSHYLIFGNLFFLDDIQEYEQKSVEYYLQAKDDYTKELEFLDSLRHANLISEINYQYRKDALAMLMEKHKKLKNIKNWLALNASLQKKESIAHGPDFDLSKTDSLMKFSYFREYLNNISQYNLEIIQENNRSSGGFYIDSRIRFDSILQDKRFNQTARNFLLFDAYNGIAQNFKIKDKKEYLIKLQENTTSIEQLNKLVNHYQLDFEKSDALLVTTLENDTLTFFSVLENNKGKWLYIDFWASWCRPCRETMPASNKLRKELENENIEFIYMGINDTKENWKKAIATDSLSESQHYFVENGNVSKVVEDLGIKTIPHYLIYNPDGTLINGFANRPGKGAKEQLSKLISKRY